MEGWSLVGGDGQEWGDRPSIRLGLQAALVGEHAIHTPSAAQSRLPVSTGSCSRAIRAEPAAWRDLGAQPPTCGDGLAQHAVGGSRSPPQGWAAEARVGQTGKEGLGERQVRVGSAH